MSNITITEIVDVKNFPPERELLLMAKKLNKNKIKFGMLKNFQLNEDEKLIYTQIVKDHIDLKINQSIGVEFEPQHKDGKSFTITVTKVKKECFYITCEYLPTKQ